MKRILLFLALVLVLSFVVGCSDDDGGTNPTPTSERVVASSTATAPSMTDPTDTTWNVASEVTIDVSTGNPVGGQIGTLASSVDVKAIVSGGNLYLKMRWLDNTHDVWADCFTVSAVNPLQFTPPNLQFPEPHEDQVLVLFNDPTGAKDPDVWNWRALTTGAAGVAQGMTFRPDSNDYVSDALPQGVPSLNAAIRNIESLAFPNDPYCVHPDTSEYDGYIISINDRVCKNDPIINGTDTTFWRQTTGWQVGDTIPGWLIDSMTTRTMPQRGSIWDITAGSNWNVVPMEYNLVLTRALSTGYTDDLDLSALPGDSVKIQIGIFDNQSDRTLGGTSRGFTKPFWLVLP